MNFRSLFDYDSSGYRKLVGVTMHVRSILLTHYGNLYKLYYLLHDGEINTDLILIAMRLDHMTPK